MGFINQKKSLSIKDSNNLGFNLFCYDKYGKKSELNLLISNPLLKITVPILKKELDDICDYDLEKLITKSILLSELDFSKMKWFCYHSYITIYERLDVHGMNVITDFIALIRCYNRQDDTYLYYKRETTVFDIIELEKIEYVHLASHDVTYLVKLCQLDILDGKAKELIFEFSKYLATRYNITYQSIYEIFTDSYSWEFIKSEKDLNYITLVEPLNIENNILFCFLIAYIKWKNLFKIVDSALILYLYPIHIEAFREFWWKCMIWAKHKDIINQNVKEREYDLDSFGIYNPVSKKYIITHPSESDTRLEILFSLGSDFFYKLSQFDRFSLLLGIESSMDKEYLLTENEENIICVDDTIGVNMAIHAYGTTFSKNKNGRVYIFPNSINNSKIENELSNKNRRGRPKKELSYYLSNIVPHSRTEYVLAYIKEQTRGKKCKELILVIRAAYEAGLFMETPSRQSLINYGYNEDDIGNDTTYNINIKRELQLGKGKIKKVDQYHITLFNCFKSFCDNLCVIKEQEDKA